MMDNFHWCLDALLQNAADATVVTDREGKIIFWNTAAAEQWQWKAQEVVSEQVAPLLFTDFGRYAQVRRAITQEGKWQGLLETRARNGAICQLQASFSLSGLERDCGNFIVMSFRPQTAGEVGSTPPQHDDRLHTFAQNVCASMHELNNAIAPFSMSLELLRRRLTDPSDAPLLELLDLATHQAAIVIEGIRSTATSMMD